MEFPFFKTKIAGLNKKFNLNDPEERQEYFQMKAGPEIEKLRKYLEKNSFIAYLLGKKNSGKGTYAKMFAEIVSPERIEHFSIGDMVREVDEELKDEKRKKELSSFLEKNYRGWLPLEKIFSSLEKRSTKTLLSAELILALVKRKISEEEKKTLFIDGFPRNLDQINFALFFRDLVGHRDDPDIFILIDVPNIVIDERIKWRRVCPKCQTSRSLKLLPTSIVSYDEKKKEFYLICDNPRCQKTRLFSKEGDKLGIERISERLKSDEELMQQAFSLYGIPKIFLRNSVPQKLAKEYLDDYEITPEYVYQWNKKTKKVKIEERPWIIKDNQGTKSISLLPPPVVVSLIKQTVNVLGL